MLIKLSLLRGLLEEIVFTSNQSHLQLIFLRIFLKATHLVEPQILTFASCMGNEGPSLDPGKELPVVVPLGLQSSPSYGRDRRSPGSL